MMPAHRVATYDRGVTPDGRPGYMAECLEPACGQATFGGFPSRTEARQALAGHDGQRVDTERAVGLSSTHHPVQLSHPKQEDEVTWSAPLRRAPEPLRAGRSTNHGGPR
jgi:hypothetical protein